jgi:hypothetical protein
MEYSPFGTRAIGAIPASSGRRDLRAGLQRHDPVFHVEEQPVEPGDRHRLGDLDAARHADADAEGELASFQFLAGNIADGRHRRLLLARTYRGSLHLVRPSFKGGRLSLNAGQQPMCCCANKGKYSKKLFGVWLPFRNSTDAMMPLPDQG